MTVDFGLCQGSYEIKMGQITNKNLGSSWRSKIIMGVIYGNYFGKFMNKVWKHGQIY